MTTPPTLELIASTTILTDHELPQVAGFMASNFAPLVYAAVRACVGDPRSGVLPEDIGGRVGIVLGSRRFDTVTLELSVDHVNRGRVSPILFYQAVPTAVLGQIARDYRLTGPVSCVAVTGDARAEVLELARVLLGDECVEWVLALTVEMDPDPAQAYASADLVRSSPESADRKASS